VVLCGADRCIPAISSFEVETCRGAFAGNGGVSAGDGQPAAGDSLLTKEYDEEEDGTEDSDDLVLSFRACLSAWLRERG